MRVVHLGAGRGGQVMIGAVVKPHGIRGEIKVYPVSGRPDDLKAYREVVLVDPASGRTRLFDIIGSSSHDKLAIVKLAGINDRDGAEALRGWEVRLERLQLRPLAADEYYWHELEGLTAVTGEGRLVGVVSAVMNTGAHDILVVRGEFGREYLIPMEPEFIARRDEARRELVITPPPGLLEMNE